MKKLCLLVALTFSTLAVFPQDVVAQEEKPINLALVAPIQIVPEDQSVGLLRLGIYGRNVDVAFFDIGVIMKTDRKNEGLQLGFLGLGHDFSGLQWNAVGSYNTGSLSGMQAGGIFNWNDGAETKYVQLASAFNGAQNFEGLQLAFVNYTKTLKGVQLGLINIATEGGLFGLPVFPFVNFNFD